MADLSREVAAVAAIYAIRNTTDGALYLGSAHDADRRWSDHQRLLRKGTHPTVALQAAWDRDGQSAFVFETLETLPRSVRPLKLQDTEQVWHERLSAEGGALYNPRFRRRAAPRQRSGSSALLTDPQALSRFLELHAVARPKCLDCTYGKGGIWGNLPIRSTVIKADAEPFPGLDLVCRWQDLPHQFDRHAIDVLVFDPLHVHQPGKNSALYRRYVSDANAVKSVEETYPSFLATADYLVKPRTGIVLAKLVDEVRGGHYRWQIFDFVRQAQAQGWTACQMLPVQNRDRLTMRRPNDHDEYHVSNPLAFWIVLRRGASCRGPGRQLHHERTCTVCGKPFRPSRADARTHAGACRQKAYRRRRAAT